MIDSSLLGVEGTADLIAGGSDGRNVYIKISN